ncbi:MAG: hypothetical protein ACTHKL_26725 [Streptosporangiaceae bacterium]
MSPARSARAPATVSTALALACCVLLAITACASGHPAGRAHDGKHAQHGNNRNLGTHQNLRALAKAYLAIAEPANHRLDAEVDKYEDERHHDLAAAESALRAQASTERQFDRNLAKIGFPPPIAATARALIGVNEIRATMAEREAMAGSIPELLSFDRQHKMADAQVEAQVRVIRAQLGLPAPGTS